MVLHNPNNWHWVNKPCGDWAKDYFNKALPGISAESNSVSAQIDKVLSMEGDVDVSQRKGKVISLFDVKLKLEYSGKNAEGEETTGSITIPEVAHDTEEDEYVFEVANYSDSASKQPVRDLIRSSVLPQLRKALAKFGHDLISEHGKDIQHAPSSMPSSGSSTPQPAASTPAPAKVASQTTTKSSEKGPNVNTVNISDSVEFNTSADQLFLTFTDPQRVVAWTRQPPKEFEPKEGGRFALFGGNVEGTFKELVKDKKIVQTWRLAEWPKGHFSTLTLTFDQGQATTNMIVSWEGVPVGQDDVAKRNFDEYYTKSIKLAFGFGAVL